MHYPVCRECNDTCGNLPNGDDKLTTCDSCKQKIAQIAADSGTPDIVWTPAEMEELYRNVFGSQTRIPEG